MHSKSSRMFTPFWLGVVVIVGFRWFFILLGHIFLFILKNLNLRIRSFITWTTMVFLGPLMKKNSQFSLHVLGIKEKKNCPRSQLPCCWYIRRNHLHGGSRTWEAKIQVKISKKLRRKWNFPLVWIRTARGSSNWHNSCSSRMRAGLKRKHSSLFNKEVTICMKKCNYLRLVTSYFLILLS